MGSYQRRMGGTRGECSGIATSVGSNLDMWQEQQGKRAMRYAEDVLQSPYGPSPGLETGGNLKQGVLRMRFSSKHLPCK